MLHHWVVRCEEIADSGTADSVEEAQAAAIAAVAAAVADAFAALAGRSSAELPAIVVAVDDTVVNLHVGLDTDGSVDASSTGATLHQLLAAHQDPQPHPGA